MQVDQLRKLIDDAFARVDVPANEDVLAPRFRNSEDPLELAAAFRGKHWRDLPARDVFRHRESLGALSGAGFRAYVAAYLVGSLEGEDAADLAEYALFSLRPTTDAQADADDVAARIGALDAPQRAAVRAWLAHQQEHHALARTLLARWS